MSDGKWVEDSVYFYAPNHGAAIFFTVAFAAVGLTHAYLCYRYKCWLLTPFFPFCSLLFTAGFALRSYGSWNYTLDDLDAYIASICITYAAPPLLELANYHILGRILYYVPYHSPVHPGRVLSTFGFLSAIVEALNGWGASYSANQSLTDSQMAAGHALIKTSLLLQIVVAVLFVVLTTVFYLRCRRAGLHTNRNVQAPLITLYTSMVIILARTIYRIVEYFGIADMRFSDPDFDPSTLPAVVRYEWYFYVFEAALMIINLIMFIVRHPRRYLPESNKTYLARDGVTEIEGPGWKDPRPFWQTFVDPFDIIGLLGRNKGQGFQKFWETDGVPARTPEARTKSGESSTEAV